MHDDSNPSLSRVSVIMAELLHLIDKTRQWCTVNSYTSIVTTFGDILYACIIFTSMSILREIHWTSSLLSVSECIWWLMMHVGRSPVPVKILMVITVIKSFFQFQHDFILFSKIADTIDNGSLFLYIL